MSIKQTIINLLGGDVKTKNTSLGNQFLRYGNRSSSLTADWSDIKMADSDMYRGYSYAVIQKRANKVAALAKSNLTTWVTPEALDIFQKKDIEPVHPYLKAIQDSTKFSEKQFWKTISIYMDLAGRYYLGVVRKTVTPSKSDLPNIVTDVKEFVLLNPYEIRRVINNEGEVAGYIERKKDGRYREWPKDMIIEMREMNPFDNDSQWSMTDAAKEAVYTLNKTGDYTRQSLSGNIDAPGIISTDVILPDEDFANFRARVVEHQKGEPLFGNGTGSIKWDSMQIDLDKAALMDINEISRTALFAVSGTSKTSLGIEQSGTTRETARVQSEQFVADTAQPRLDDIIDFLNLDYKRMYKNDYDKVGYTLEVKSAVASDYDTETKAVSLRKEQFALAQELIYAGYSETSAYQYAQGEIDLQDLEQDGIKPADEESGDGGQTPPETPPQTPPEAPQAPSEQVDEEQGVKEKIRVDNLDKEPNANLDVDNPFVEHEHHEGECSCEHNSPSIETYTNEIGSIDGEGITTAYNDLLKEIRSIQRRAIKVSEENITVNSFEESDLISKEEREKLVKRLTKAFNKYWTILVPIFAARLINKRNKEFNANYSFKFDNDIKDFVSNNAKKVADGHIETIMGDILEASNKAYTDIVEKTAADLIIKAYRQNPEKFKEYFEAEPTIPEVESAIHSTEILEENRRIYERANRLAMEGLDRKSVVKAIRDEYKHLSEKRATTIARNETSRAFGQSQYQADYQFLNSIGKLDKAYKELYSRTGNPCPYCKKLIEQGPIPFTQNFLDKGDSIEIVENGKVRTFTANYENIAAGTVHVNCQCSYRLVFLDDNGKITDVYNSIWGESANSSSNSVDSWLNSHSNTTETKEINGGSGSGNFGHLGRPGKVGGSGKGKAITSPSETKTDKIETTPKGQPRYFAGTSDNPVMVDMGEESKRPGIAKLYQDGTVEAQYRDGSKEILTDVIEIEAIDHDGKKQHYKKPTHEIKPSNEKGVSHMSYQSDKNDPNSRIEWEQVENPIYLGEYFARTPLGEIGCVPSSASISTAKTAYAVRDGNLRSLAYITDGDAHDTKYLKDFLKDKFKLTDSELEEELIKD